MCASERVLASERVCAREREYVCVKECVYVERVCVCARLRERVSDCASESVCE